MRRRLQRLHPAVHPGATELCNGIDDNCDGRIDEGCTAPSGRAGTPGYWMNHPEAWCMQTITLGCVTYSRDQAIAIMKQSTSTDRTYALAAQLATAKLNTTCKHSDSSCVSSAIASADAWLCQHPVGSGVKANSAAWKQITPTFNTLVSYDVGKLCAPKCK